LTRNECNRNDIARRENDKKGVRLARKERSKTGKEGKEQDWKGKKGARLA
jgi:hypothetical protein